MASTAMDIGHFLEEARQLPTAVQWELIEALIRNLKETTVNAEEPLLDIRDLAGLGKEIWEGIDPQTYIDQERDSWR